VLRHVSLRRKNSDALHPTTPHSAAAFGGYRCPDDIIAPVVRWYLRFRLPYCRIPGELRRCSLPVRTLSHYPCATQTSRAPCEPYPTLPRLFFPATRPPTLPTYPPIHEDRRKVSGTFCRSGAGFLRQSAHLARNSLPFHT